MAKKSEEYQIAQMQAWRDVAVSVVDGITRNPIFSGLTGVILTNKARDANWISGFQHGALVTAIMVQVGNQAIAGSGYNLGQLAVGAGKAAAGGAKLLGKGAKALKNKISGGKGDDIIIVGAG